MLRACVDRVASRAVAQAVGRSGFTVLRPLSGHGIGRTIHEPRQRGRLTPGLVFTIEPIISAAGEALSQDDDGWTVRTRDGSLTAHAEHTVVVTRRGSPLVLTSPD
jgi:methionyl aminopeptidase